MMPQTAWPEQEIAAWESAFAQAAAEMEFSGQLPESSELETQRSGQATVQWAGPYTVSQAIQAGRGKRGLYVIYRHGQVVDSGKAESQDLATRLAQHFEFASRHREPLTFYRVRLGFVRQRARVNLAEGTVTRSLAKEGLISRTRKGAAGQKIRVPNTARFRSGGTRGVRLVHRGAMPRELRGFTSARKGAFIQTIGKGQRFEYLPPHLLSELALEHELEIAAAGIGTGTGEAEAAAAARWHFWDAWLSTSSTGWRRLEAAGPVLDTRENGERIRSTLQLKWQPSAQAQGGTLLARCFSWTGSQWVDCKNHFF